jgi:hypothetical protein
LTAGCWPEAASERQSDATENRHTASIVRITAALQGLQAISRIH